MDMNSTDQLGAGANGDWSDQMAEGAYRYVISELDIAFDDRACMDIGHDRIPNRLAES